MSLVGKIGRWMQAANFLAALQDNDSLATALKNGTLSAADFAKLAAIPNFPIPGVYKTPVIDLLGTGTYSFDTPLAAGKAFIKLGGAIHMSARTGNATGGLTWGLAQNGVGIGNAGQVTANTLFNVGVPGYITTAGPSAAGSVDMTSFPLQIQVSVGVVGPTVLQGRFYMLGIYV